MGEALIRRAEPVMGTVVSIHVRAGDVPPGDVFLAMAEARARLHRADAVFSTWKPDSPVSRLRRGEIGVGEAPAEVRVVLDRCVEARDKSGGWFDPWASPGGFDPTGLVKGWAAEQALEAIRDSGALAAMVNAGGDVAVFGHPAPGRAWRIGVQNPFDRATLATVVEPSSAIATSGTYERGAHVFDPFEGRVEARVASATVTGPDLDLADALATGLLAGGQAAMPAIEGLDGYEALLIGWDGAFRATAGFGTCPAAAA